MKKNGGVFIWVLVVIVAVTVGMLVGLVIRQEAGITEEVQQEEAPSLEVRVAVLENALENTYSNTLVSVARLVMVAQGMDKVIKQTKSEVDTLKKITRKAVGERKWRKATDGKVQKKTN